MSTPGTRGQVQAIASALGLPPAPADWTGCDAVLPLLERMRADGAVVVVKLDGERTQPGDNGPYTVLASGRPLAGDFLRTDADSLEDALAYVIVEYAKRCWAHR